MLYSIFGDRILGMIPGSVNVHFKKFANVFATNTIYGIRINIPSQLKSTTLHILFKCKIKYHLHVNYHVYYGWNY